MESDAGTNKKAERWRTVVRVLGILAVVLALLPSCRTDFGTVRSEAERKYLAESLHDTPSLQELRLGWPASPLVRLYRQTTVRTNDQQQLQLSSSSGFTVGFITWSMATMIFGILLLKAARWKSAARN